MVTISETIITWVAVRYTDDGLISKLLQAKDVFNEEGESVGDVVWAPWGRQQPRTLYISKIIAASSKSNTHKVTQGDLHTYDVICVGTIIKAGFGV